MLHYSLKPQFINPLYKCRFVSSETFLFSGGQDVDLDAILGELCELETQLTTQQTEINDSLHKAASSTSAKYAVVRKDSKRKQSSQSIASTTSSQSSRSGSIHSESQQNDSLDRSSGSEGVNPFDAIQSQFQSALSELSGLVGGSMDPIYDPNLYGGLNTGTWNSQSSETLICDSNSSTLTHNQSKSSATKQKQQHQIQGDTSADRQNANTEHSVEPTLPKPPQIPLLPNLQNGNNRTSSGSEGNSSDSGFHQMSSGQSNYSDDSLPPPPAGLKLSPSPEPSNGNLQIDCDCDAQQDFAHEGYADVDSAFSDSVSLPSSGSHISVTTTSSGSSMGSGGITNSPTPVRIPSFPGLQYFTLIKKVVVVGVRKITTSASLSFRHCMN